jgi:D-alanyl-D-alanine carboxypeptidase/D-alanyl-D-alanine-endopeptidase (penicillin-binding protein 4)
MRLPFSFLLFSLLLFSSCATSRHTERCFSKKIQKEVEKSPVFRRAFTGFTLLDPETGKTLADVNGDKYFTPASNTKILTLATCLEVLGDSVPRFRYVCGGPDSSEPEGICFVTGTGDPTTLHPFFQIWQQQPPKFFQAHPAASQYFMLPEDSKDLERFGPGWMWDDFHDHFSPEISALPVYGNMLRLCWDGTAWTVHPDTFRWQVLPLETVKTVRRHTLDPTIEVPQDPGFLPNGCFDVPMYNPGLTAYTLLNDSMWVAEPPYADTQEIGLWEMPHRWFSTPLDTVLRRMMYQSDNFIAEQMLLVCAGQKFDLLEQDTMIKWMLDSVLTSLPQRPRWVDGSGLSRYNLISPRDLAQVLLKLWQEQPHNYLLSLFPAGGVNGTVSDFYKGKNGKPYVFAKTGGMSGVHCLSGYVVTKRGKTLIFSFMHNNFVGSNRAWKEEMQRILELIAN